MKNTKGFTIYAVFGQYAGFQFENTSLLTRVVIGWVSIAFIKADLEFMLDNAAELVKYYQHNEKARNLESSTEESEKVIKQ